MSRILIADDEPVYSRQLELFFGPAGHEIRVARTAREALDVGARWRPNILLTDWMMRGDWHGLHIALALRTVNPAMHVLLVTGFPSEDLRAAAKNSGVTEFIAKPFTLDRISTAVTKAAGVAPARTTMPPVAILEVNGRGVIGHANPWARELLQETEAGATAKKLNDVLHERWSEVRAAAGERWIAVRPRALTPRLWDIRVQIEPVNGTRLVVLRHPNDPQHMTNSLIDMLLGVREVGTGRWALPGRVLILSDNVLSRRLAVSMLESAGAGCYAVATPEEAVRLLSTDDGLAYAVLDYDAPGDDLGAMVATLAQAHPGVVLVGASLHENQAQFRAAGIVRFMTKPWRRPTLTSLLTG
jgi:CheY-like chemotaxis protein